MSNMKMVIESIFGVYTPVSYMQSVTDAEGNIHVLEIIPDGVAGVDWAYVLGVLGFFLILYSFFRLLGVWFKC